MSSINIDRKMRQTRPALLSYAVAVLSVALATALRLSLNPVLGSQAPLLTYVIAVALVAWYAGLRPALVASVLGMFAARAFILLPQDSYLVLDRTDVIRFAPYLILCIVISLICEVMRRTRARAEENALAFAESRNLLSTTLASIGDAVITTDEKGRVTFLNPVAETLTGWAEKDAKGKPLEEVFNIVHEQTRKGRKPRGQSPDTRRRRRTRPSHDTERRVGDTDRLQQRAHQGRAGEPGRRRAGLPRRHGAQARRRGGEKAAPAA
jgi:PAS domain S-box-containing protein